MLAAQNHAFAEEHKVAITGTVTDKETNEPLMYATVYCVDTNQGTSTNPEGKFNLTLSSLFSKGTTLRISLVGYKTEFIKLESENIQVKLSPEVRTLNEIVVVKQRYRRKNNPALELLSKVIENKKKNSTKNIPYIQNEKYEKVQFALDKITPDFQQKSIFKRFQFVFENIDSVNGQQVLPVFLKESIYRNEYQQSPSIDKSVLVAHKSVSFDGFDKRSIDENIRYLYQDVDIYSNNIPLLSTQFLSPLAGNASLFYRYYIQDTLMVGETRCVKLYFAPRNKVDLLFEGNMYIAMDSSYAVRKLELTASKTVNVNFVSDIKVIQEFQPVDHKWILQSELLSMKFGLSDKKRGIIGQKAVYFSKNKLEKTPESNIDAIKALSHYDDEQMKESEKYLEANRAQQLSKSEMGVYTAMDSITKVPVFKRVMSLAQIVLFGYKDFGKFEVGPINTFYMYNDVEGLRLRLGGRTTNAFSKKINLETYAAYGFKDEKWKYYLGGTWSLSERGFQQFPVKAIRASYQQETQFPGQQMQFLMEDNFLLSIKRGQSDKMFYNKTFKLEHINEFENHFSYTIGYKYNQMAPGGNLYFNYSNYNEHRNDVDHINVSEFNVSLRYAPNESFYQGKTFRVQNYNRYPILELRYTVGNKLWGNDYNYHNLRVNLRKRMYWSVLGYSDVVLEGGKIFGKVPYPLLHIPQANQSYSYQIESYNLMNFMEFAVDQYASLLVDHTFNGFFFSKIPLISKLGLREHVSMKMLYGSTTDHNNPEKNSGLFQLPLNTDGSKAAYVMGDAPYIEGSVGIGNLFKIFRIDLVKRFNYLDHSHVSEWGLRMRFRLDF